MIGKIVKYSAMVASSCFMYMGRFDIAAVLLVIALACESEEYHEQIIKEMRKLNK